MLSHLLSSLTFHQHFGDYIILLFHLLHHINILNIIPNATNASPYYSWYSRPFDLEKTPLLPFGAIVAAHRPLASQQHYPAVVSNPFSWILHILFQAGSFCSVLLHNGHL